MSDTTNENMCRFLLLFVFIIQATNVFVSASTDALIDKKKGYPLLRYTDTLQNMVDWSDAVGVEKLTSCLLIRITRRGVRCVPSTWTSLVDIVSESKVTGWVTNPCKVSNSALCVLKSNHSGEIYHSFVFPDSSTVASIHETENPVLNPDTKQPKLRSAALVKPVYDDNMVMQIPDLLRIRTCQHGSGRRVLPGPGRRYDITACDLFDTNIDFIYVPASHTLLIRMLDHGYIEYGITSVLVLVIIVFIAEELAHEIMSNRNGENTPTPSRMLLMIATWCALLIMSFMLQFTSHRSHVMVTEQDRYSFWGLFSYILMYTIIWVMNMIQMLGNRELSNISQFFSIFSIGLSTKFEGHSRNHGINSMLASTFFAIQVLTGSSDNIYSQPFFFVFLYRMLYKTYGMMSSSHFNTDEFHIIDRFIVTADILFIVLFF
jgi:hypothetical protein